MASLAFSLSPCISKNIPLIFDITSLSELWLLTSFYCSFIAVTYSGWCCWFVDGTCCSCQFSYRTVSLLLTLVTSLHFQSSIWSFLLADFVLFFPFVLHLPDSFRLLIFFQTACGVFLNFANLFSLRLHLFWSVLKVSWHFFRLRNSYVH